LVPWSLCFGVDSGVDIPGAQLGIVHDGNLVYVQGYGKVVKPNAGQDRGIDVSSDSLFRIASVTKPITAAGIYKLNERDAQLLGRKAFGRGGILPEFCELSGSLRHSVTTSEFHCTPIVTSLLARPI
jgi:hypothetical protein